MEDKLKFIWIARHCGEPGSGGSRRPLLMAQALEAMGHSVTMVTPYRVSSLSDVIHVPLVTAKRGAKGGAEGEADKETGGHANDVIAIEEKPAKGLRSIPRRLLPQPVMQHIRLWKDLPDIDRHWAAQAADAVILSGRKADWVITTSPPESLHGMGRAVADACGGLWCAELRDSWVENSHRTHVRGLRALIEAQLAGRWLSKADALTTVDGIIKAELGRLTRDRVPVFEISHFSDRLSEEEVPDLPLSTDPAFNLLHSGGFSLSDHRRRLGDLLSTLDALHCDRVQTGKSGLSLHIAGRLSEGEQKHLAARQEMSSTKCAVTSHGPVDLVTSRHLQSRADGLLLFIPDGSCALPGKYAEYALSGRPIFYHGPEPMRARANTPDMLRPMSDLLTVQSGQSGPVDRFYDVAVNARRFCDQLRALMDTSRVR